MKTYTSEELDDLHNHLYALLSFLDRDNINRLDGDYQVQNHIEALTKRLKDLLFEHGGRHYQPYLTNTQESQS